VCICLCLWVCDPIFDERFLCLSFSLSLITGQTENDTRDVDCVISTGAFVTASHRESHKSLAELDMMLTERNVDLPTLSETPLDHVDGGHTSLVRQGGSSSVCVTVCIVFVNVVVFVLINVLLYLRVDVNESFVFLNVHVPRRDSCLQGGYLEYVLKHASLDLFNVCTSRYCAMPLMCTDHHRDRRVHLRQEGHRPQRNVCDCRWPASAEVCGRLNSRNCDLLVILLRFTASRTYRT
jgi:hypothetical protein